MEQSLRLLEGQLEHIAGDFPYPPTPNIAGAIEPQLAQKPAAPLQPSRRLTWGVMAAALIVIILLALPPVRTVVFQVVYQGIVRVFLLEPLPTATPLLTITPAASVVSPTGVTPQSSIATPRPSATPIASMRPLSKKTAPAKPRLQMTAPPHPKSSSLPLTDEMIQLKTNLRFKPPPAAIEQKLCYNGAY